MCCASGLTGAVKRLDESTAEKLRAVLQKLLIPMVEAEHQRHVEFENLPHVRLARTTDSEIREKKSK
ncbi:hypothetical protein D3C87_2160020 [compost metagenome]